MLNAKVTRPAFDEENAEVILTATVSYEDVTKTKEFRVLVKREGITDSQAVIVDLTEIKLPSETRVDLDLPTIGKNGSTITWTSDNNNVLASTGVVNRPNVGEDDITVTLTARATKGIHSETKDYDVIVKAWTYEEEIADALKLINWDFIKLANTNPQAITSDLNLPSTIGRKVDATWETPTTQCNASTGKITRPSYTQGSVELVLTCTLEHQGLKEVITLPPYMIAAQDMTVQEVLDNSINDLQSSLFLGDNTSLNAIVSNMILPVSFTQPEYSLARISWSLANKTDGEYTSIGSHPNIELFVNPDHVFASITRPSISEGNKSVSLVAKVSVDNGTDSVDQNKYFDITILVNNQ